MGISSAKLRQLSVSSLIFLLKSLRWFVPSVIGLLAIWMIGGNFLASQQEKEIEQDIEEFVKRFPDTEPNDSALKLRALMAKLGRYSTGVIRKLEYLPVEWQQRLLEHDYHQSYLTSLETEFIYGFNFMLNVHLYSHDFHFRC